MVYKAKRDVEGAVIERRGATSAGNKEAISNKKSSEPLGRG
jgi:hypothetical protein